MSAPSREEREREAAARTGHGAFRWLVVGAAAIVALSSLYVSSPSSGRQAASRGHGPGGKSQGVTIDGGDGAGGTTGDDTYVDGNGNVVSGGSGSGGRNGSGGGSETGPGGGRAPGGGSRGGGGGGGGGAEPPPGLSCPGSNGGATDVGVDGGSLNLASTEVRTGIGSSFLGSARYGMLAVVQQVNRSGGICGRQIKLQLIDDAWDPQRGKQFIDNFIQSNQYLALPVLPSSNGLDAASKAGDLAAASFPAIGTDGMLNSQYADPWIWPVAASTGTTMRIMAHDAIVRARSSGKGSGIRLGIVYDVNYAFGPEGAGAFVKQAEEREGGAARVPSSCRVALTAGAPDYGTQVKNFNDSCGEGSANQVDFVALLLEPDTALKWLKGSPFVGTTASGSGQGFGGPQPLFDKGFFDHCGAICNNMGVWTSFYPPIAPFDQRPAVQAYKADLCLVDSNCDTDALNAFTEGSYVGMKLVMQVLSAVSPFVTRDRLAQTLDSTTLDSGLSAPLKWSSGNHFANQTMTAFRNVYAGGAGQFQYIDGSEQSDPCSGCIDPALGG